MSPFVTRLARLARRLVTPWAGTPTYCPDFRDTTLFQALRAGIAADIGGIGSPSTKRDESRRRLIQHFRARRTPHFLVDPHEVVALTERLKVQGPSWIEGVLAEAAEHRQNGLKCYAGTRVNVETFLCIDASSADRSRDILYPVHPHRFAFAPRLALATHYGAATSDALRRILETWMMKAAGEQRQLAYASPLVAASRAIALTWGFVFLAAHEDEAVDLPFIMLKVVLADARFIATQLGRSVANNHLLVDGFALWYLGSLFPEFAEADRWRSAGGELWLRELKRQVYADGTSFEHSVHYHAMACEMAIAYFLLTRKNEAPVPDWFEERLERMLRFQAILGGPEGSPPAIGDATDDTLFPLGDDSSGSMAFREVYRTVFSPRLCSSPPDHPGVERAFWLLGGALATPSAEEPVGDWIACPDGGFDMLLEAGGRTRLVFRSGPLADRDVWGGHMHADLLSVYVTVDAQPVLVDSGTFTYRAAGWPAGTPPWRAYFLGPTAHNGPVIEGEDPLGRTDADFRSSAVPSRVRRRIARGGQCLTWVEAQMLGPTAYDGYRRGIVHVRSRFWLSYDLPPPSVSRQRLCIGFQLAPGARVDLPRERLVRATVGDATLCVASSDGLTPARVICGATAPVGGWVSRRYGEMVAAPRLHYNVQDDRAPAVTILWPERDDGDTNRILSMESMRVEAEGVAVRLTHETGVEYVLVRTVPGSEPMEAYGIRFTGSLLWARASGGTPVSLAWLDGERAEWRPYGIRIEAQEPVADLHIPAPGRSAVPSEGTGSVAMTWPSAG